MSHFCPQDLMRVSYKTIALLNFTQMFIKSSLLTVNVEKEILIEPFFFVSFCHFFGSFPSKIDQKSLCLPCKHSNRLAKCIFLDPDTNKIFMLIKIVRFDFFHTIAVKAILNV